MTKSEKEHQEFMEQMKRDAAENNKRNIVIGVIGTIILVILQALICFLFDIKPHYGPF